MIYILINYYTKMANNNEESMEIKMYKAQERWEAKLPTILESSIEDIKILNNLVNVKEINQDQELVNTSNNISNNASLKTSTCKTEAKVNLCNIINNTDNNGDDGAFDNVNMESILHYDDETPENMVNLTEEIKRGSILAVMKFRKMIQNITGTNDDQEIMECNQNTINMQQCFSSTYCV